MKVAAVKNTSNKFLFGPEKFDADEIAHARKMGIMIDEFQNTYTGEKYHANQCGNCGSFIKKYNKLKDYFSYAVDERFPMTDYYIKYHCSHCAEKKISDDDNWVQNLKW